MSVWLKRFRASAGSAHAHNASALTNSRRTGANGANGRGVDRRKRPESAGTGGMATTVLDGGGLPARPCPGCGGGIFWCPVNQPPEWGPWRCASCEPQPMGVLAHACALPPCAAASLEV